MKHRMIIAYLGVVLLLNIAGCVMTIFKTELIQAASKGDIARSQELINKGANIDEVDKNGWSALSYAISYGYADVVQLMLQKGANPHLKDISEYTYLHIAVIYNQPEIVKVLLKNKVNINKKTNYGESALHLALSHQLYEIAELLVDNGADVNARNNNGATPLHYAAQHCIAKGTARSFIDSFSNKNKKTASSIVDLLINKKAEINVRDTYGSTPLSTAIYYKNDYAANLLAKKSIGSLSEKGSVFNKIWVKMDTRYKVIEQTAAAAERIKNINEFKIKNIDFTAINAQELGYPSDETWNEERSDVPKIYANAFSKFFKEYGLSNKKIVMLNGKETVTNGIVVDVEVKKIIQNWTYGKRIPDIYLCNVCFTDQQNGEQLYTGIIAISSLRDPRLRDVNMYSASRDRAEFIHTSPVIRDPDAPRREESFIGRLHIAAYNMTWVVTQIIRDGKINTTE